jgi:hypothetical protein
MRTLSWSSTLVCFLSVSLVHAQTMDGSTNSTLVKPAESAVTVRGPAPVESDEWKFEYHGFFRAPMRVGMAQRQNAGPGQSSLVLHNPRVPDDQYLSWLFTRNQERDWAEMFFSYGNSRVTGTASIQGFNFTDASWNNTDAQFGIAQGFVTWTPALPIDNARLQVRVGSFAERYGMAGKYDAGKYDTYLFGRTHAMGERLRGEYDLGEVTLKLEHGLGTRQPHPQVMNPRNGLTLLHHLHAGASYRKLIRAEGHYMTAWTQDDVATQMQPDGRLTVMGVDVRTEAGMFGELYLGYANMKASHAMTVAPVIESVHAYGGGYFGLGVTENYLGPMSNGNGSVNTILFQYDYSIGLLLRNLQQPGSDFHGDAPDITLSLFGMYNWISSDDQTYNGMKKLKVGAEAIYTPLSWLGVGARFDRLSPNTADSSQTFSIISPKIMFRSQFVSHELITLQYSKYDYGRAYFLETRPPTTVPSAPVTPGGFGAPGITGPPDENVFKIQATMWW